MLSTISAFSAAATFWSAYILPGPTLSCPLGKGGFKTRFTDQFRLLW